MTSIAYAQTLLVVAPVFVLATASSFGLAMAVRRYARREKILDQPRGGRKIHHEAMPLLGGWAIGLTIIFFVLSCIRLGWLEPPNLGTIQPLQISGFLVGVAILLVGGYLDDRYDLSPRLQILFPILAAISVILTGTSVVQVTRLAGHGGFSLVWWQAGVVRFPADLLTLLWLLAVTYAMKFLDGLDGLVTGQTVIGAGLIAALALSPAYFQPPVFLLALIIAAAFLGFLPWNIHPAKQFLGEAGSTLAGFSLGFLSIVGGAKVATALMALGLPLADASLVMLGRLVRGAPLWRGDDTHLHFKLLKAGLSQREVVFLLWLIALLFGLLAFGLQTRGKILLVVVLVGLTVLLSVMANVMRKSRLPNV